MRQRTIAESRPAHPTQSQTSTSLPAASPQITGEADTALPSKSSTNAAAEAPVHQESHRPPKVSAQSLFNQRPAPPSATREPETDTPGTGALSTHSPHPTAQIRAEQQRSPKQEQPGVDKEVPTEESTPVDTPNESPDTQATDTLSLIARPTRKLTSLQLTFLHCKTCRRQPVKQILLRLRRL